MKWARRYRARLRAAIRAARRAYRGEFHTISVETPQGTWTFMDCVLVGKP